MGSLNAYKINLVSLKDGLHDYSFEIKDEFFAHFEDSIIDKADLVVTLNLTKRINLLIAEFNIEGTIRLVCDRSLEEFDYPVSATYIIHFKYADDFEEVSDEIIHIPFGLPQLDLSQYIYEYIGISVPMRKIHPKFADDSDEEEFEEVYTTSEEDLEEEESKDENEIDPRWSALKDLKK